MPKRRQNTEVSREEVVAKLAAAVSTTNKAQKPSSSDVRNRYTTSTEAAAVAVVVEANAKRDSTSTIGELVDGNNMDPILKGPANNTTIVGVIETG